jgi:crossover junction endodeoxyribonuclease RuvC
MVEDRLSGDGLGAMSPAIFMVLFNKICTSMFPILWGLQVSIERMFVLGIDPGLTRCGFGLVEGSFAGVESFRAIRAGVVETDHKTPVEERLGQLLRELRLLMEETKPDAVVVERLFFQRNAKTAISVAQASGVAVALAGAIDLPVRQFTAQEVKLAVTGYGAADKMQVQSMVARLCGLVEIPKPADAADALALAITYFMMVRMEQRYPVKSPV